MGCDWWRVVCIGHLQQDGGQHRQRRDARADAERQDVGCPAALADKMVAIQIINEYPTREAAEQQRHQQRRKGDDPELPGRVLAQEVVLVDVQPSVEHEHEGTPEGRALARGLD